ncbi:MULTISPECIES: hypothetical protein [unclassified Sinorhizobium]|uniref:hypothetical protein n=1 Tax=unclassified Sinorhizobium TaxID=2613772 RepID=UPI00352544A4
MSKIRNALGGRFFRRILDYADRTAKRRRNAKRLIIHPSVLDDFGEWSIRASDRTR